MFYGPDSCSPAENCIVTGFLIFFLKILYAINLKNKPLSNAYGMLVVSTIFPAREVLESKFVPQCKTCVKNMWIFFNLIKFCQIFKFNLVLHQNQIFKRK
jgi:hypothetical protein